MDKNGWIPVETRLPEEGSEVCVSGHEEWGDGPWVGSAMFSNGEWYWPNSGAYMSRDPVAWQPLPEPYKNE